MLSKKEVEQIIARNGKKLKFSFRFDTKRDAYYLDWIIQQFIMGEMTGILEGDALMKAPDLEAADFLALQVRDEIRHAKLYEKQLQRIRSSVDEYRPPKIPWLIKKIVNPINGRLWPEHCFLDKCIGEHWVLQLMLTLQNTVKDERLKNTLKVIARDEVQHINFGEQQTLIAIDNSRFNYLYLLGLFFRNEWALGLANRLVGRYFRRKGREDLAELAGDFFARSCAALRDKVNGLMGVDFDKISRFQAFCLAAAAQTIFFVRTIFYGWGRRPRLKTHPV